MHRHSRPAHNWGFSFKVEFTITARMRINLEGTPRDLFRQMYQLQSNAKIIQRICCPRGTVYLTNKEGMYVIYFGSGNLDILYC